MIIKKTRKPRTTGSDLNFDGPHMFGKPYNLDTPASNKLWKRLRENLCLGCGQLVCKCKSGGNYGE